MADNPREHAKETVATLVRDEIQNTQMTPEQRELAEQLLGALRKIPRLPEHVSLGVASQPASDRRLSREIKDACFSSPPIVDAVAAATINAANHTWVVASQLRNMLRAWLQRQSVGEEILAATPFTDAGVGRND